MNRSARRALRPPPLVRAAVAAGAAVGLALAAGPIAAQEGPGPLVTDRPDRTESAALVAPGFVQVEAGWTVSREEEDGRDVTSHSVPETLVRVGITPWLEGRAGIEGWQSVDDDGAASPASADGFGDASVGAKLGLIRGEGSGPAVSLLGSLSLPVGDDAFGTARADPAVRATVAHELPSGLSLGWNVGVEWETVEEDVVVPAGGESGERLRTESDVIYTVALGIPVGGRVGAFLEGFGALGVQGGRPDRHAVDGGLTFLVADNLQLDASAGLGLSDAADDFVLGAGASVRLPR